MSGSEVYDVTTYTPIMHNAGTDEDVYIHISGPQGSFSAFLDSPGNDREQGQKDQYKIKGPLINPIQEIGFRLERVTPDGNWIWYCKSVEVVHLTTGYSERIDDFGWVDKDSTIIWKKPS
jgi:PLAT/LH2 domain